jgi:hypothetical protein
MPISTEVDSERNLVVHRLSGKITFAEVSQTIETHFATNLTRHTIWNLSEADLSGFDPKDLATLVTPYMPLAKKRAEAGAKTAFVAPQPVNFGLCRIVEAVTNTLPFPRQVFYSLDEAMNWLMENGKGEEAGDRGT